MVCGLTCRRYFDIIFIQGAFGDPYWEKVRSKFYDLSFRTEPRAERKICIGQRKGAKGSYELILRIVCKTRVNICRTPTSGKHPEQSSVNKICHPRNDELTLLDLL